MHPPRVYIVDDEPGMRAWVLALCEDIGFAGIAFDSGRAFIEALDGLEPGCVLLDLRMPGFGGIAVQEEMARRGIAFPVIVLSGYGDVERAVQSMRLGAVDFLEKPIRADVLAEALRAACTKLPAE